MPSTFRLAWVLLVLLACKTRSEAESDQAADASEAASCDRLASEICTKAGPESAPCQTMREAAKLLHTKACDAALTELEFSLAQIAELGKTCSVLAEKLCSDVGVDTDACKMVREKTPAFPPSQCEEMMAAYDEVLAELRQMEARNRPLSPEQAAKIAAGNVPAFGPANAAVTVVEFSDFQCPYCAHASETVKRIKQTHPDEVRFVFRQFPLSFHPDARLAAEAALAAHDQGKFWPYHDLLFDNQNALDRASLERYAEQIGLDMTRFRRALDEHRFAAAVDEDLALGGEVSVDGTPTIFVNGIRLPSADWETVAPAIDSAIASR